MAFVVRVVHFDDDDLELARRVPTQVEAGRVEDVAEDAQVRDEGDPPAVRVDAFGPQMLPDRLAQVDRRRVEVIAVPERQEIRPVAPDEPDPLWDLVQLVEIESDVVDVVLQRVHERTCATVAHLALEQVRPHAARSRATGDSSSATSNPDRQPSSWNP